MTEEQLNGLKSTVATLTEQVNALEASTGSANPAPSEQAPVEGQPAPVETAPAEGEVPTLTVSQANKMVADAVAVKDQEIETLKTAYKEKLAQLAAKYQELMVVETNAETGFADLLAQAQA